MTWLIFIGVVMGAITLGVIWWATPIYGEAAARTMGLTVFALANVWFALETNNEEQTIFSSDLLENPTLIKAVLISFLFTIGATELRLTNRVLETVNLNLDQWAVCIVVSLVLIVIPEIKKLLKISTTEVAPLAAKAAVEPA